MHAKANTPAPKLPRKTASNLLPTSQPPDSSVGHSRRRNGKIARLPDKLRQLVNEMLHDGTPYSAIIKKLAEAGHNLNEDNLSRWYTGGYQDWLDEQSCLNEMRLKLDFASQLVTSHSANMITESSLRLALLRLYNLLLVFDPMELKDSLATSPGLYTKLLDSVCKLTSGALKHEQHRLGKTPLGW
jgi:hypothetical protein